MPVHALPSLYAHRGFSSQHPEMTRAAYVAAIDWCRQTRIPLGLECDVHFSADDQLICLHDLAVDRTSDRTGQAYGLTVADLKTIDFGAGRSGDLTAADRELVTLTELADLVADARAEGVPVGLAIETKHPNPRGLEVEERVAELLVARGWAGPGSPARVISFSVEALVRTAVLLPEIQRSYLFEREAGPYADGSLPAGVTVAGVELAFVRREPEWVARSLAQGNAVHVWTVNTAADVDFCLDLGVTGLTTDDPALVASAAAAHG